MRIFRNKLLIILYVCLLAFCSVWVFFKIQERDIDPMKTRYKEFLGVSKVPNRWTKVNSLEGDTSQENLE